MNNKLPILSLALAVLTASLLPASPVRSNIGGDELLRIDDSLPQNLWVWPTEVQSIRKYHGPNAVWVPQIGVWYVFASNGGYVDTNYNLNELVGYTDVSVTATYDGGYSAGCFTPLLPGDYLISAMVDGAANFRVAFYEQVDGGYRWVSGKSLGLQTGGGYYERSFSVPSGCSLALVIPTSSVGSAPPLTVTNIEIYRLD